MRATRKEIERRVKNLLGALLGLPADSILTEAHLLNDLGADSWQVLEFRTELERLFQIAVPDRDVDRLASPGECAGLVLERLGLRDATETGPREGTSAGASVGWLSGEGRLNRDGCHLMEVEVGISLMGRCNLAETPLLKLLGEIRWDHLGGFTGVPSRRLTDEAGDRLYASFYYTEFAFPRRTPMGSFRENDRFRIVSTLESYGRSILDGTSFFYPASWPAERTVPFANTEQALAAGVPYFRASNIFVKMFDGASWLKKSRPAQPGMAAIPQVAEVPPTYLLCKRAGEEGRFLPPPANCAPLTSGSVQVEYRIEADRDLNGVGLLYYANYPMIMDLAERRVLSELALIPLSHDLLDRRTLVSRQCAYLSNASQSDCIDVFLEAWLEDPFLSGDPDPELSPVRLFLNHQMRRRSDGRLMAVSTAEKVVLGKTLEESGLLEALQQRAAAGQACPAPEF